MGMIANLLRVSETELDSYLADSSLLAKRLYNDDDEADPARVDIDKSWDSIIFLLTGEGLFNANHSLVRLLFSGQLVDENQELGYGPAHYLTPEEVAGLNEQLATIQEADLKQKFDPQKMSELEIYPNIWAEGDNAFDYVAVWFKTLQRIYAEAARNGQAMITFLS